MPWLRGRVAEGAAIYVDAPRRPEMTGNPPGMAPIAGVFATWTAALSTTFPEADVRSALPVLRELRWVKSAGEVAALRANARATVTALWAAARRIAPGVRQRQSEAAVIAACIEAGAEGPSFWPWTMSGPNAQVNRLVRAFYAYRHLDRAMLAGELVRVDIGCRGGGYGADVGRTVPVSGRFGAAQRAVWELLVDGYLAGLDAVRPGIRVEDVRTASTARVRAHAETIAVRAAATDPPSSMRVEPAAAAAVAEAARQLGAAAAWHLHGVGIESGEEALPILRAGTVFAYEPMVQTGTDAWYLEDMVLVTETGHEVLSSGLPTSADAIERMSGLPEMHSHPEALSNHDDAHAPTRPADSQVPREVHFRAEDGTRVWADLYESEGGRGAPLVLLFHQSASNAGEYDPAARRLRSLGYNALAVDARGGGPAYGRHNRTIGPLAHHGGGREAYHDFKAALAWADEAGFTGTRVLWGSSYSAGRMFQLLAEGPPRVAAALSFSPGAGFARTGPDGEPSWAARATVPVFMTWSPEELDDERRARFATVGSRDKTLFVQRAGVHGAATVRPDRNPEGHAHNLGAALEFIGRHAPIAVGRD